MNLAEALGGRATARVPCPSCARSDRDRTFSITHDERGIVGHCFRCGSTATEREERLQRPITPPKVQPRYERLHDDWRAFWNACAPIRGTLAETYLRHRACVVPPEDGDVRFHERAHHWPSKRYGPAMVALLTDAVTREPRSLHFTFLQPDGRGKADVDPARLLLARHTKAGCVVRLWPDEAVTTGLCIAEGIETALSAAHAFTPVWAAIDAGNLAGFPHLTGLEALTIAADADKAGRDAAQKCAARLARGGLAVFVVTPEADGADINDLAVAA